MTCPVSNFRQRLTVSVCMLIPVRQFESMRCLCAQVYDLHKVYLTHEVHSRRSLVRDFAD